MALGLPFEVLIMHYQSSYTAARGALLMAWRFWLQRRNKLITSLCQPVYELWLEDEVAQGHISAPGFFADPIYRAAWSAGVWTGDGPGSIDPQKEVGAAQARVDLGISTKQAESILHDGVDWKTKHKQRVKEINAEKADGIYIQPAGSPATPPEPAPPAPEDAQNGNATLQALTTLTERMCAIEREPRQINVHTPPVNITQGAVNITTPPVTVTQGDTHVTLPEGCVQLEAVIQPAPITVAPAPVVIQPAQAVRETYSRDAAGNLTGKTVTPIN
jgi:hypothetical protein